MCVSHSDFRKLTQLSVSMNKRTNNQTDNSNLPLSVVSGFFMIPFLTELVIKYLHVVYVRACDINSIHASISFKVNMLSPQISYYRADMHT